MPQLPDLTRPIMRRAASLNANQTRRQGLEERQYFRPLKLPPQYCLASSIDAVQLEDTLGDVQTDCGNLHGGWLLLLVALNGPSLAHRCRQGVVHRIRFSQPVSSTIRAAVVDATALTAEERRQRARAAIL